MTDKKGSDSSDTDLTSVRGLYAKKVTLCPE